MRYTKFTIENYKGIKKLDLDLSISPDHKIYTLIGLNESGKTTILEAINDFELEVPNAEKHKLIPKSAAGGFTGDVVIKATLSFSDEDKARIIKFVSGKGKFKEVVVSDLLTLERKYKFENSKPIESKKTYVHFVSIKKTAKSKLTNIDKPISEEVWTYVKDNLLPEIIFYRDFLSKFPEKIFLEPEATEPKEKEYLSIIEDVLVSINPSYTVKDSLLSRLGDPNEANKQALEAVENEIGAKISEVVFDAWSKIQSVSKKEIVAKTVEESGRYFIKLSVKEGHQSYAVAERSLGFRWFFTFLLYTEFRKERIKKSGEILFLLDEPASNLHQSAQKSLLGTFESIVKKSRLVYTTHSHHLINPLWLNASYIIKNKGLKYGEEDNDFTSKKTEVEAYKYKQFVSSYPTQTDYFKPILDVLDYQPGLLEMVPNIVITEGKFDFFTFKFFQEIVLSRTSDNFHFYPGHGASNLDLPIALYESWGKKYFVVLDSDKEGREQAKRYVKEYSSPEKIATLDDVNAEFKNISTENLFTDSEKLSICKEFNPAITSFEKSAFNTGVQILYSEKRIPEYLTEDTKNKIDGILNFCATKF